MKRVVITGHTKGIGNSIYNYFKSKDYEVIGVSRSTGYDISNIDHRKSIIDQLKTADIFVNNAYVNFDDSQLALLESAYYLWKDDKSKIIINVSSRAAGATDTEYAISKYKMDQFCMSKVLKYPHIINLKPGLVDTARAKNYDRPRMDTNQVVEILDLVLNVNSVRIQSISFGV